MSRTSPSTVPTKASVLIPLLKVVLEAALEAELLEHLRQQTDHQGPRPERRNARNGSRPKTVRTAVGPVTLEVPRDRWGTFDPLTVGKWQREVVRIDRLLLLLAAYGVPHDDVVAALSRAYPRDTPRNTLVLIGQAVRAHLRPWHQREVRGPFPVLHVHLHAQTSARGIGGATGPAVVSVVGTSAPDARGERRRELLSLRAMAPAHVRDAWQDIAIDLHRRQLREVGRVEGAAAAPLREAAAGLWLLDGAAHPLSA